MNLGDENLNKNKMTKDNEASENLKEDNVKEEKDISISSNDVNATKENKKIKSRQRFNLLQYFKIGINAVNSTFYRFPLTILLFVILAAITIYRIEMPYVNIKDINDILDRISGVIALGIPFTLSINLVIERFCKKDNLLFKLSIYIVELALLILYYFTLLLNMDMVPVVRLIGITSAMILAFLFIPYLFKRENYEIYITKVITRLTTTVLFTIVLALGLVAVLFAVKSLLYDAMDENYFVYTWILAWMVFAPVYFLHGLPKRDESFFLEDYSKVLKVLLFYIIMSIISIYSVVLFLYFGKVIITQEWPKGIVSYLVLSYSAVGISTIFLIAPFVKQNKWARIFTSVYTKLIFPLLAMMFMSISIRINEFGFTENRYFILIIGIWATLAMIFINFNKGKNNIILPISLAVVVFLTVCGPLSAFNVSKISQSERFYYILEKYDMISNGKVVNNNSDVDKEDQKEITEILYYFERSHKLSELKYLPKDFEFNKMEDVFGFTLYNVKDKYLRNFFGYNREEELSIVITGYDILCKYQYEAYEHRKADNDIFEKVIKTDAGDIKISIDEKNTMYLLLNNTEIYQHDLLEPPKELYKKYGDDLRNDNVALKDLSIFGENDKVKVMFLINQVRGSVIDSEEIELDYMDIDILVKIK